jgi:hypothetical protein
MSELNQSHLEEVFFREFSCSGVDKSEAAKAAKILSSTNLDVSHTNEEKYTFVKVCEKWLNHHQLRSNSQG